MDATQDIVDPQALLQRIDSAQITDRLRELEGERRALLVLLRAANARQRGQRKTCGKPSEVTT
jgi:hypothetical protein